jgi:hypothetical protein
VSVEALRELTEKVEDGDAEAVRELIVNSAVSFPPVWLGVGRIMEGSLDAAKALHEAVLPDFILGKLAQRGETWVAIVTAWREDHPTQKRIYGTANADNPARAWLLAILKALIAQEESK